MACSIACEIHSVNGLSQTVYGLWRRLQTLRRCPSNDHFLEEIFEVPLCYIVSSRKAKLLQKNFQGNKFYKRNGLGVDCVIRSVESIHRMNFNALKISLAQAGKRPLGFWIRQRFWLNVPQAILESASCALEDCTLCIAAIKRQSQRPLFFRTKFSKPKSI